MARIIHGTLFVPSYVPTGNPGEYTITGATYENFSDATSNGAYDLTTGFVLFVPCVDPNTFLPVPGEVHRYVITSITIIDQSTIDCTILWDEDTEPTEVDYPEPNVKAIITEKGGCLGLGLPVSQQVYSDLLPGVDIAAIVNDEKNKIECGATGPSGFSGYSGIGQSGYSGTSGYSGQSGVGLSGFSGFTGASGFSGARGPAGTGTVEKPIELVYEHSGLSIPVKVKTSRIDGLNFPTSQNTGCDSSFEIPDDYELNTDLFIVGSFYADTVEVSSFRMVLDYEVVNIGQDATPVVVTGSVSLVVPNPSLVNPDTAGEFYLTIPKTDISAITERIRFTLQRNGTHVSDDYSGNIIIEDICFRYTGFGAPTDKSGVSGFSGFSGTMVGGLFAKTVEEHTADDTLTAGESGSTHTNTGTAALVTLGLPSATIGTVGTWYTFICDDADGLKIQANGGDYIRIGSNLSLSGGYAQTNTIGATLALTCIKQNYWYAEYGIDLGNWTVV